MTFSFQVATSSDLAPKPSAGYTTLQETEQGTDSYAPPPNYMSPDAYPPPQEMKDSPVSDTISIGRSYFIFAEQTPMRKMALFGVKQIGVMMTKFKDPSVGDVAFVHIDSLNSCTAT